MDTPTAPFVAFIESSNADNDDWITDHSGDPDLITWDGTGAATAYTEGTDAIVFTKILSRKIAAIPGNRAEPRAGGNTFEYRSGRRRYGFQYKFLLNSRSEVNTALKFPMLERHTEASTPYVDFYLVDLQAANDHITFQGASNATKSYCQVHITEISEVWNAGMSNKHMINVSGVSTW